MTAGSVKRQRQLCVNNTILHHTITTRRTGTVLRGVSHSTVSVSISVSLYPSLSQLTLLARYWLPSVPRDWRPEVLIRAHVGGIFKFFLSVVSPPRACSRLPNKSTRSYRSC